MWSIPNIINDDIILSGGVSIQTLHKTLNQLLKNQQICDEIPGGNTIDANILNDNNIHQIKNLYIFLLDHYKLQNDYSCAQDLQFNEKYKELKNIIRNKSKAQFSLDNNILKFAGEFKSGRCLVCLEALGKYEGYWCFCSKHCISRDINKQYSKDDNKGLDFHDCCLIWLYHDEGAFCGPDVLYFQHINHKFPKRNKLDLNHDGINQFVPDIDDVFSLPNIKVKVCWAYRWHIILVGLPHDESFAWYHVIEFYKLATIVPKLIKHNLIKTIIDLSHKMAITHWQCSPKRSAVDSRSCKKLQLNAEYCMDKFKQHLLQDGKLLQQIKFLYSYIDKINSQHDDGDNKYQDYDGEMKYDDDDEMKYDDDDDDEQDSCVSLQHILQESRNILEKTNIYIVQQDHDQHYNPMLSVQVNNDTQESIFQIACAAAKDLKLIMVDSSFGGIIVKRNKDINIDDNITRNKKGTMSIGWFDFNYKYNENPKKMNEIMDKCHKPDSATTSIPAKLKLAVKVLLKSKDHWLLRQKLIVSMIENMLAVMIASFQYRKLCKFVMNVDILPKLMEIHRILIAFMTYEGTINQNKHVDIETLFYSIQKYMVDSIQGLINNASDNLTALYQLCNNVLELRWDKHNPNVEERIYSIAAQGSKQKYICMSNKKLSCDCPGNTGDLLVPKGSWTMCSNPQFFAYGHQATNTRLLTMLIQLRVMDERHQYHKQWDMLMEYLDKRHNTNHRIKPKVLALHYKQMNNNNYKHKTQNFVANEDSDIEREESPESTDGNNQDWCHNMETSDEGNEELYQEMHNQWQKDGD